MLGRDGNPDRRACVTKHNFSTPFQLRGFGMGQGCDPPTAAEGADSTSELASTKWINLFQKLLYLLLLLWMDGRKVG